MGIRAKLTSRFAHFAGAAPIALAAAAADDGDDEARRAAAVEEEAAAKKPEEEEAKKAEDAKKARKSRRAKRASKAKRERDGDDDEDDDDGDDASDDEEEDDDDADMKKAARAGHDMAMDAAFRMGARAQRRRCAAILAHPAAAANPVLAMSLAFDTSMTASAAIMVMDKTPAPTSARGQGLHDRMAATDPVRVRPGAPQPPTGPTAVAKGWDAVMSAFAPRT